MPRSSFGPYGMAECGDEEAVRILRIDGNLGDLLGVAKAEVRPGLARVGRLVDAVADREVGARQAFAAADVDDVRVDGATATQPIDPVGWSSKIGFQVRPASVVFQTPPFTMPM